MKPQNKNDHISNEDNYNRQIAVITTAVLIL